MSSSPRSAAGRPGRLRSRVSRLPLRVRLVAGFTAAMTIVLIGTGAFLYWRVSYALDQRLDADLVQDTDALRSLLAPDGTLRDSPLVTGEPGLSAYQVLDRDGRVLSAGAGLGTDPLLGRDAVRAALDGPVYRDVGLIVPISERPLRLLATPVAEPGPAAVLVVGLRRDERDEALRELVGQLVLAGLGALVVTAVVGERLARAALTPVERYRTRAQAIASGATGVRLDVPQERDDEVTRLGHTLNDMLVALERSAARERRFLDDASHELRTPLTLLSTRVQLTLRRTRTVAEHEAVLHELDADVTALAALAERLLQLGAVPDGASPHPPDGAPIGDVARVVAELAPREEEPATGLLPPTWTVDSLAPGTTPVAMPDGRLRQVVLNLLTNAAVHGAPPVTVRVRSAGAADGAVVVLTVNDAGPGVPASFLPSAVERFSRTDVARDRPGAGLGLSLVHALVAGHGGEFRLCSGGVHHRYDDRFDLGCDHPVEGATATVLLPAAPPVPPSPA
ncbi:Signal transduction histidine kinase [Modestobacter sp. DSM 44400]|uniref:ATP-binding protein n=1 Tax=Modestobacter sp. DSM 44400 TaxID=1550230 RepID=UPI000894A3FB|nr:ATP-binding protein [Modestobacter sp. DSM 44400]SDX80756.1 Signal transduction histidine kinase [Modestobacter sp. DSM 44400]